LEKKYPTKPDCRHELARSLINRGVLRRKNEDLEKAQQDYGQAINHLTTLRGDGGSRAVYRHELALTRNNLGNLLYDRGRHQDALREHRQALELFRGLVADFPARPGYRQELANTHNSLGRILHQTCDWAGAEQNWSEARHLFEHLVGKYPRVSEYQQRLGMTLHNLGLLRSREGDWPGCRSHVERAVGHLKKALDANPAEPECRRTLRALYQTLAETCVRLGDHERAVEAAVALAQVFADRALDSYYAACFVARSIPLAEKDAHYPGGAARQALAAKYADQAVMLLREAIQKGPQGIKRLPNEDAIFGPLLQRRDFRELRSKLPGGDCR
jgi:tetratricopeptide (TPR) repeat protein